MRNMWFNLYLQFVNVRNKIKLKTANLDKPYNFLINHLNLKRVSSSFFPSLILSLKLNKPNIGKMKSFAYFNLIAFSSTQTNTKENKLILFSLDKNKIDYLLDLAI